MNDLKQCRNNRCSRFQAPVQGGGKRCVMCNSKMRAYSHDIGTADIPIIIEFDENLPRHAPSPSNGYVKGQHGMRQLPASTGATFNLETQPESDEPLQFESNCDLKGTCPIAPKGTVNVPFDLYQVWQFLCLKFDVEWIAYLRGTIEGTTVNILPLDEGGMYFPVQTANGGHVEAEANSVQAGTVASIHSHVDMKAFFSSEDVDHFNFGSDMVINRRGEMDAVVRHQLECHRWTRIKADVNLIGSTINSTVVEDLRKVLTVKSVPTYVAEYKDTSQQTRYANRDHSYSRSIDDRDFEYLPGETPDQWRDRMRRRFNAQRHT